MNSSSYLLNVVNQWKSFCKSHKNFEKALSDVLAENQSLKNKNAYLTYRVDVLENRLKGGEYNGD